MIVVGVFNVITDVIVIVLVLLPRVISICFIAKRSKKVMLKFIRYPDIYGLEQKVIMTDSHLCISKSTLVCT